MKPGPFLSRWHDTLRRSGPAEAVVCAATGLRLTFAGLDALAGRLAAGLPARVLRGRPVLLHRPNAADWPGAFLALHRAGAIVVPVDADTPEPTVSDLAASLRAAAIYDRNGYRPAGPRAARKRAGLLLGKLTSGSTGAPKLHLFTEEQMLADADAIRAGMGLRATDINHAGLPFSHSYALGNLILPLFAHGMPMVVASSHFPGVLAAEVAAHRPTVLPTVPAIIAALNRANIDPGHLRSLRCVISAGAPLAPGDARAFAEKFPTRVHNFYGSSETGGVAYDATGDHTMRGDALGAPLPGVTVSRLTTGRLLVSGPAVRTHGNRRRHGAYGAQVMGDLGRITPAGDVVLDGRATGFIKIGGRRINPAAVEHRLRELAGVREAFVGAVCGPDGEPRLAALVAGDVGDPARLREALRRVLPAWSVPSRLRCVTAFPVTARGKTNRAALLRLLDAS